MSALGRLPRAAPSELPSWTPAATGRRRPRPPPRSQSAPARLRAQGRAIYERIRYCFGVNPIILTWKRSLARMLALYDRYRRPAPRFFVLLFLAFVLINLACYWCAMFTAFPEYTRGAPGAHYFKIQFPVGLLGAIFDSLSFFVTIFIIRRALRATSTLSYVAHLSVDLVIAIAATWWVLFVFTISGWIISQLGAQPQLLSHRSFLYENRALNALENPAGSLRNIYFGLVMGASAMIPTTIHLCLSLKAFVEVKWMRLARSEIALG